MAKRPFNVPIVPKPERSVKVIIPGADVLAIAAIDLAALAWLAALALG
jgi:hypothetical protein